MSRNWKVLNRWHLFRNRFLNMRVDRCELPDGRVMPNYYVLDFSDWVQVIALDEQENMIMVRQYRHGLGETLLEIPGGSTEPGSTEDPMEAAKRELQEETGYTSSSWQHVSSYSPNPALMSNRMHVYIARGCTKTHEQALDPLEDLDVEILPLREVYKKADGGEMIHGLVLAALTLARESLIDKGPNQTPPLAN